MKLLVLGGGDDLCQSIKEEWPGECTLVSRKTNFDMQDQGNRRDYSKSSLDYDCVLVHACPMDFSQSEMVYDLFEQWSQHRAKGTIFVTGSSRTYNPKENTTPYLAIKKSLDIAVQQCNKAIENDNLPFQMVNLRLGMLDNEKSRKKEHWLDNGISGSQIAQLMVNLHTLPGGLKLAQMDLYQPLPG